MRGITVHLLSHILVLSLVQFCWLPPTQAVPGYLDFLPNGNPVKVLCPPSGAEGCTITTPSYCNSFGHALDRITGEGNECSGTINNVKADKFGEDFKLEGYVWTEALCKKDSDGDGQYNGQELGDPCCVWQKKDKNITNPARRTSDVSHPGSDVSTTSAPSCDVASLTPPAPVLSPPSKATTVRLSLNDPNPCTCQYAVHITPTNGGNNTDYLVEWISGGVIVVYGLVPKTQYDITVKAKNFDILSSDSAPVSVTTGDTSAPEAPGLPRLANLTTNGTVIIEWDPPIEYGGLPIQQYVMKLDLTEIPANDEPSYTFTDLQEESTYVFRVKAVNTKGSSSYSLPLTFRTGTFSSGSSLLPPLFAVLAMLIFSFVF